MNPIRTLIVDDEAPARQWLRALCDKQPDVQVIGECGNASDATRRLHTTPTDLLLLDIQLGPSTGFQVLEGVAPAEVPLTIIVTAFDEYAVRAFEKNAVDYLLKPVREDRFRTSLDRVRRQLVNGLTPEARTEIRAATAALERTFVASHSPANPLRVVAEGSDAFHLIDPQEIEFVESRRNYAHIHALRGREPFRTRSTLQHMNTLLDPASFLRINRSYIVNLRHVLRIERNDYGAFFFVVESQRRLPVGRSYRAKVAQFVRSSGRLQGGALAVDDAG